MPHSHTPRESHIPPTRRTFLKGTTATAVGSLLAPAVAARAYAAGSDEIRIALVGCGGRGTGAVDDALTTSGPVRLVAMADVFEGRLKASLERLTTSRPEQVDVPEDRQFVGLDAYRRAIDTDCNLVINATPPGFRPLHLEYTIGQGKNAFIEKPVAVDAPGGRQVLAAADKADEAGLKIAVGLQRRHDLPINSTIDRLQDGAIGDLLYSRVYRYTGGVWTRGRQDDQTEMQYQVNNWYYFNWLSGDFIAEQHIHELDVVNWLKGGRYPVLAQGVGGREVRTGRDHGEIYDHFTVEFIYDDDSRMISMGRHIPECWNHTGVHVHGSRGYADVLGARIEAADADAWRYRGDRPNMREVQHQALINAIRNNEPFNQARYGAMSSMTAILGRYALYSGQRVRMEDALARGKTLAPGIADYTLDSEPPVLPDDSGYYPVAAPGQTQVLDDA